MNRMCLWARPQHSETLSAGGALVSNTKRSGSCTVGSYQTIGAQTSVSPNFPHWLSRVALLLSSLSAPSVSLFIFFVALGSPKCSDLFVCLEQAFSTLSLLTFWARSFKAAGLSCVLQDQCPWTPPTRCQWHRRRYDYKVCLQTLPASSLGGNRPQWRSADLRHVLQSSRNLIRLVLYPISSA